MNINETPQILLTPQDTLILSTVTRSTERVINEVNEQGHHHNASIEIVNERLVQLENSLVNKDDLYFVEARLNEKISEVKLEILNNLLDFSKNINELQKVEYQLSGKVDTALNTINTINEEIKALPEIKADLDKIVSTQKWYKWAAGLVITASISVITLIGVILTNVSEIAALKDILIKLMQQNQ